MMFIYVYMIYICDIDDNHVDLPIFTYCFNVDSPVRPWRMPGVG